MNRYFLPELPYALSALEPHISAESLEIHHARHHATYVKQANALIEQLAEVAHKRELEHLGALEKALAFNLSGHVLHSLFWRTLSPHGGGRAAGTLLTLMDRDFGGFDRFREQFTAAANGIMGSGWAALVWEPLGRRLLVAQFADHQSNLIQGSVPLMVVDAWEHAYYLQYKNDRKKYLEQLWEIFDWKEIQTRFLAVEALPLGVSRDFEKRSSLRMPSMPAPR